MTAIVTKWGERAERARVQWAVLRPFLVLAALTILGLVANVTGLHQPTSWSEDVGMNVALTAFTLWTVFLCSLACVDRPKRAVTLPGVATGSFFRTVAAIARRIGVG